MSPQERLRFHQKQSGPLMEQFEKWLAHTQQIEYTLLHRTGPSDLITGQEMGTFYFS